MIILRLLDNTIYSYYTNDNNINIQRMQNDLHFKKENIISIIKNVKILSIIFTYLLSFGLEITLYTNFQKIGTIKHKLTLERKIQILFVFSIINLIARPIGGYISDINYSKFKIIGKIKTYIIFQLLLLINNIYLQYYINNNNDLINELFINILIIKIFISIINNFLQGSIIGLIPHFNDNIGASIGIAGAFGILGGIIGNILFKYYSNFIALTIINGYTIVIIIINVIILL